MRVVAVLVIALLVAFGVSVPIVDGASYRRAVRQITMQPPFPRCVFYECIANCRQRGHASGGYCTINGCQCLR